MIYISFPSNKEKWLQSSYKQLSLSLLGYKAQDMSWWGQLRNNIFTSVNKYYKDISLVPWDSKIPLSGSDILITFLPNQNMLKWKRTISIDNSNFDCLKWNAGKFKKGCFEVDIADNYMHKYDNYTQGILGHIIMSNDVAISRCKSDELSVRDLFNFYKSTSSNVFITPHPIDKTYWSSIYDPNYFRNPTKMLVYHNGERKNSSQLISMLLLMGLKEGEHFDVTSYIKKDNLKKLKKYLTNYNITANCSYSETGPVNLIEIMANGQLIFGHEEWWSGCGHEQLRWSYDPQFQERNKSNLAYLFNQSNIHELHQIRNTSVETLLNRNDNNWSVITDKVIEIIKKNY